MDDSFPTHRHLRIVRPAKPDLDKWVELEEDVVIELLVMRQKYLREQNGRD